MKRKAQGTIEYFVILTLILAAIISSGVIGRIRGGFQAYFDSAVERLK